MITKRRLEKLTRVANQRFEDVVVVLEDIHDPHNAMAALRNCDAFGVQQVHFIFQKEVPFNPKKVGKSSSSSANKWLDFHTWKESKACFSSLKQTGYKLWVTNIDQSAAKLWKLDFKAKKLALVFGNEHRGVSEVAKKMADKTIYIPMFGMVDSLNLSVSVGVVLYELRRQRKTTIPSAWHKQLLAYWLKKWCFLIPKTYYLLC